MTARLAIIGMLGAILLAGTAAAAVGSANQPIAVHFRRGTDSIRYTGVLRQNRDCCAYRFKARAGQVLHWRGAGAVVGITLLYPDGHQDGPGFPEAIPLPMDGAYVFSVRPNLMADGGFGRFTLTMTIPPVR